MPTTPTNNNNNNTTKQPKRPKRSWDTLFAALVSYKRKHGDCSVPQCYKPDPALGEWVSRQRERFTHALPEDPQRKRLSDIGFDWESRTEKEERMWNVKYNRLCQYKVIHGHCRVPRGWKEDTELADWVSNQRALQTKGRLTLERHTKLEQIQFTWAQKTGNRGTSTKLEEKWQEKYFKLQEYHLAHGHVVVPRGYKQDGLGYWVDNQRALEANGDLPAPRRELLDKLGFVWRVAKARKHAADAAAQDLQAMEEHHRNKRRRVVRREAEV